MTETPLFYRTIVPLNKEQHRELHLDSSPKRFGFAAASHLVPVVIDEFEVAARHLPILFVPNATRPTSVFLVGSRPGESHFVDAEGRWTAGYIPAYLRRYPFIIGDVADAEPLVCIDQDSPLLGSVGEKLFQENGEHTPMLNAHIRLMTDYRIASSRTDALLAAMVKLDLFRTITINVRVNDQESRSMHGLMIVDGEKLNRLSETDFMSLRADGFLSSIYAHLISLSGLEALGAKNEEVSERPVKRAEPPPKQERRGASDADDAVQGTGGSRKETRRTAQ